MKWLHTMSIYKVFLNETYNYGEYLFLFINLNFKDRNL